VVEPMSVEGGYVTAFDHLTDSVRTFAVARITGIAPAADAPA
jgi:predicted DNA-binding transcriptional regulator YafY